MAKANPAVRPAQLKIPDQKPGPVGRSRVKSVRREIKIRMREAGFSGPDRYVVLPPEFMQQGLESLCKAGVMKKTPYGLIYKRLTAQESLLRQVKNNWAPSALQSRCAQAPRGLWADIVSDWIKTKGDPWGRPHSLNDNKDQIRKDHKNGTHWWQKHH